MTINQLQQILEVEKVNINHYSLSEETFIEATEGLLIRKTENGKWKLIFEERGVQKVEGVYSNQHDVCIEFLKEMAYSYKQLQKYIPKSEAV